MPKKSGIPMHEQRRADYQRVFGSSGERSPSQERIWKEIVMTPLLTSSAVMRRNPRSARDVAAEIYKLTEKPV